MRGRDHFNSLLLGFSCVVYALHYCIGLAHPTNTSSVCFFNLLVVNNKCKINHCYCSLKKLHINKTKNTLLWILDFATQNISFWLKRGSWQGRDFHSKLSSKQNFSVYYRNFDEKFHHLEHQQDQVQWFFNLLCSLSYKLCSYW